MKLFFAINNVKISQIVVTFETKNIRQHKRNKIGFVTCKNKESYDSALKLNGIELQNKSIVVVPYSLCEYTETLRL